MAKTASKIAPVKLHERLANDIIVEAEGLLATGLAKVDRGDKSGWSDVLGALTSATEAKVHAEEARSLTPTSSPKFNQLDGLAMRASAVIQMAYRRTMASLTAGFLARLTGS